MYASCSVLRTKNTVIICHWSDDPHAVWMNQYCSPSLNIIIYLFSIARLTDARNLATLQPQLQIRSPACSYVHPYRRLSVASKLIQHTLEILWNRPTFVEVMRQFQSNRRRAITVHDKRYWLLPAGRRNKSCNQQQNTGTPGRVKLIK